MSSKSKARGGLSVDFKVRKARVGKGKLEAVNSTNTSFSWSRLNVPTICDEGNDASNGADGEDAAFLERLDHTRHHNVTHRSEALDKLRHTCLQHPSSMVPYLGDAVRVLSERILDPEPSCRCAALNLMAVLFSRVSGEAMAPFFPLLIAYLASALSSMQPSVRLDACATIAVLDSCHPKLMARALPSLLAALPPLLEPQTQALVTRSLLASIGDARLGLGVVVAGEAEAGRGGGGSGTRGEGMGGESSAKHRSSGSGGGGDGGGRGRISSDAAVSKVASEDGGNGIYGGVRAGGALSENSTAIERALYGTDPLTSKKLTALEQRLGISALLVQIFRGTLNAGVPTPSAGHTTESVVSGYEDASISMPSASFSASSSQQILLNASSLSATASMAHKSTLSLLQTQSSSHHSTSNSSSSSSSSGGGDSGGMVLSEGSVMGTGRRSLSSSLCAVPLSRLLEATARFSAADTAGAGGDYESRASPQPLSTTEPKVTVRMDFSALADILRLLVGTWLECLPVLSEETTQRSSDPREKVGGGSSTGTAAGGEAPLSSSSSSSSSMTASSKRQRSSMSSSSSPMETVLADGLTTAAAAAAARGALHANNRGGRMTARFSATSFTGITISRIAVVTEAISLLAPSIAASRDLLLDALARKHSASGGRGGSGEGMQLQQSSHLERLSEASDSVGMAIFDVSSLVQQVISSERSLFPFAPVPTLNEAQLSLAIASVSNFGPLAAATGTSHSSTPDKRLAEVLRELSKQKEAADAVARGWGGPVSSSSHGGGAGASVGEATVKAAYSKKLVEQAMQLQTHVLVKALWTLFPFPHALKSSAREVSFSNSAASSSSSSSSSSASFREASTMEDEELPFLPINLHIAAVMLQLLPQPKDLQVCSTFLKTIKGHRPTAPVEAQASASSLLQQHHSFSSATFDPFSGDIAGEHDAMILEEVDDFGSEDEDDVAMRGRPVGGDPKKASLGAAKASKKMKKDSSSSSSSSSSLLSLSASLKGSREATESGLKGVEIPAAAITKSIYPARLRKFMLSVHRSSANAANIVQQLSFWLIGVFDGSEALFEANKSAVSASSASKKAVEEDASLSAAFSTRLPGLLFVLRGLLSYRFLLEKQPLAAAVEAKEARPRHVPQQSSSSPSSSSLYTNLLSSFDRLHNAFPSNSVLKALSSGQVCDFLLHCPDYSTSTAPPASSGLAAAAAVCAPPSPRDLLPFLPPAMKDAWLQSLPKLLWGLAMSAPANEESLQKIVRVILNESKEAPPLSSKHSNLKEIVRRLAPIFIIVKQAQQSQQSASSSSSSHTTTKGGSSLQTIDDVAIATLGPFAGLGRITQELLLHLMTNIGGLTPTLRRGLLCHAWSPQTPPSLREALVRCALSMLTADLSQGSSGAEEMSAAAVDNSSAPSSSFSVPFALQEKTAFLCSYLFGADIGLSLDGSSLLQCRSLSPRYCQEAQGRDPMSLPSPTASHWGSALQDSALKALIETWTPICAMLGLKVTKELSSILFSLLESISASARDASSGSEVVGYPQRRVVVDGFSAVALWRTLQTLCYLTRHWELEAAVNAAELQITTTWGKRLLAEILRAAAQNSQSFSAQVRTLVSSASLLTVLFQSFQEPRTEVRINGSNESTSSWAHEKDDDMLCSLTIAVLRQSDLLGVTSVPARDAFRKLQEATTAAASEARGHLPRISADLRVEVAIASQLLFKGS